MTKWIRFFLASFAKALQARWAKSSASRQRCASSPVTFLSRWFVLIRCSGSGSCESSILACSQFLRVYDLEIQKPATGCRVEAEGCDSLPLQRSPVDPLYAAQDLFWIRVHSESEV